MKISLKTIGKALERDEIRAISGGSGFGACQNTCYFVGKSCQKPSGQWGTCMNQTCNGRPAVLCY
ncbi:hypothetical protein [uncultured Aquimarina sp.]|uniref:hypothetical protein n=1 Tax=uncultured Aquimarina sp. TaxID=575652 RepID=UPI002633DBE9|nr:hypothetical protein [uncultured Aquimarina sp.]